jgi:hypothetical protein
MTPWGAIEGSVWAVLLLLFGLLRSGQIRLRRLVAGATLPPVQLSPPEVP